MPAVIYTRFSPRRNADDSESCVTQEAQCREYAEREGLEVRSVHSDEGVSGKEVQRLGLEAALSALQKGDVLLVYRRDRLARDLLLSEMIHRRVRGAGATVAAVYGDVALGDGPEATLVRQILDAVAEHERKLISARTSAAMRTRQANGDRVGRFAPYGFKLNPEDPRYLVPNPDEQEAAARARELVASGLSPYQAARRMDVEYPDVCRGKSWSPRTVEKIAKR